jgi:S-adenosyl methyltransferase
VAGRAGTAVIQADMRNPDLILNHTDTQRLIDFTQPLAILFVAVLHFIPFTDRHPVGSALTWAFTSRTCSRRPNQKISEEEAGAW